LLKICGYPKAFKEEMKKALEQQNDPLAFSDDDDSLAPTPTNAFETTGQQPPAVEDNIDHTQFRLTHKPRTLSEVWDEWHGLGDFSDPLGGVEGRNARYGPRWRKHINGMAYSRFMRTVQAIKAYSEEQGMDTFDACAELQGKFLECKLSLGKFVEVCKANHLLPTLGARGRSKKSTET
jgi:hypothetical protein